MAGALAAYYRKIPVDHVEAGLRSGNIYHPWPEEVNRKIIGAIASLHFAPTDQRGGALRENVDRGRVHVTGNTVIDALHWVLAQIEMQPELAGGLDELAERFAGKRIIGVTSHRRENFGEGMENIASAIRQIAARPDVAIIFPVHLNPNVRAVMNERLVGLDNVALIEPLDYPHFARLLSIAEIMLTDSGGVQEEAPALGKPVLVMRETTERPEGVRRARRNWSAPMLRASFPKSSTFSTIRRPTKPWRAPTIPLETGSPRAASSSIGAGGMGRMKSDNKPDVCVVGLGYIGLPTAAIVARSGAVCGRGCQPEGGGHDQPRRNPYRGSRPRRSGPGGRRSRAAVGLAGGGAGRCVCHRRADALWANHEPDVSYVLAAARSIAPVLKAGDIVILDRPARRHHRTDPRSDRRARPI
jgi:hypothetical protein